jgi:hypothetical protein
MPKIPPKEFIVYLATNTVNGKRYVGATSQRFSRRRNHHLSDARRGVQTNSPFHSAIRKYGEEAFKWTVIATAKSLSEMMKKEIRIISIRKPEYNVSAGGCIAGGTNKTSVLCLEDGRIFKSLTSAADFYDVHLSDISMHCRGLRCSVGGLHFILGDKRLAAPLRRKLVLKMEIKNGALRRKVKKRKKLSSKIIINGRDILGRSAAGPMSISRQVICLDDLEIYPSATAAALYYDVARSALIELCLGKNGRQSVSGRRFCYLENYRSELAWPVKTKKVLL